MEFLKTVGPVVSLVSALVTIAGVYGGYLVIKYMVNEHKESLSNHECRISKQDKRLTVLETRCDLMHGKNPIVESE